MPFVDAADGGHDLAGRTIAALKRILVDERLLHGMKRPVLFSQPFNGSYRASNRGQESEARQHLHAADLHGAGTALTMVTSLLCPGEAYLLAQGVEKSRARFDVQPMRPPIDGNIHNGNFFR